MWSPTAMGMSVWILLSGYISHHASYWGTPLTHCAEVPPCSTVVPETDGLQPSSPTQNKAQASECEGQVIDVWTQLALTEAKSWLTGVAT